MEITNEIKAKVFAQYLGQYFKVGVFSGDLKNINIETDLSNTMLVLKPLSSITDEDAIEATKHFGRAPFIFERVNDSIEVGFFDRGVISIGFNGKISDAGSEITRQGIDYFISYQYLQSKGYDLPQYLLGGKTLKEAGLAIYEQ